MTTRSIVGALAAAALAAFIPCALVLAAPDAPPKPAAEMSTLKVFDGSWTCDGKMEASPMGPAGATKSTVKSQVDLGGYWQSGTVKSTTAGMPGAMEGMFHMTYEPATKQYVLLWVDNMGGYARSLSPGWQGDAIAFSGDSSMGGTMMKTRDTFTTSDSGTLKHDMEAQIDGKWVSTGTETCKKSGATK